MRQQGIEKKIDLFVRGKDANLVETSGEGVLPSGLILGQGVRSLALPEVSVDARSR